MNLGLVGCGKMGSALLRGILGAERPLVAEVWLHDAYPAAMEGLRTALPQAQIAKSNVDVAERCDVLLLCLKPTQTVPLIEELASVDRPVLCISVAAGVTIAAMEASMNPTQRLIRVMPNTPALVGAGASAFALGSRATREDAETAKALLNAVGIAVEVPETLLDAVTGLSGSGPAYVYIAIEALADGGVLNGLPRSLALQLAAQTVMGAGKMVLESGEHPGVLKDQVASPGGTTIRGLAQLEEAGLRSALINAVTAATERSKALGA